MRKPKAKPNCYIEWLPTKLTGRMILHDRDFGYYSVRHHNANGLVFSPPPRSDFTADDLRIIADVLERENNNN